MRMSVPHPSAGDAASPAADHTIIWTIFAIAYQQFENYVVQLAYRREHERLTRGG